MTKTIEMPEAAAHMYPSDLEKFKEAETFAHAYSVAVGNPDERSVPLFTLHDMVSYADELHGLLLWLLWHHQGGSSDVGQPIRKALGIGPHDPLTPDQVATAKRAGGKLKPPNAELCGGLSGPSEQAPG